MGNSWSHIKAFLKSRDSSAPTPHEQDFVTSSRAPGKVGLDVHVTGPLSAYGDMLVNELTPVAQIEPNYGLRTKTDIDVFTDGTSGSVTIQDNSPGYEYRLRTGTGVGGYGVVRSLRQTSPRPGEGMVGRFECRFATGTANHIQRAGWFNIGNELTFGYVGTDFGVLRRTGGRAEIRELSITAAGGNDTITIQLNGVSFAVSTTAATTTALAFQIAAATFTGWDSASNSNTVCFIARSVDPKTGTYDLTSTGSGAGDFTQIAIGASVTDFFITQSSWNMDILDGGNDSAFLLDPLKGNVYEVEYQHGYGAIDFFVEDPESGKFVHVHQINYANNNVTPSLDIPSMKVGALNASLGSTTDLSLYLAHASGFIEGKKVPFRNPDGHIFSQTGVGTTFKNIVSLRNSAAFNGKINYQHIEVLLASIAVDGTKPAEVGIFINPEFAGDELWHWHDNSNSSVELMDTFLDVSVGSGTIEVAPSALAKADSEAINLGDLGIELERTDVITIAVRATSGNTDATGSLTWLED